MIQNPKSMRKLLIIISFIFTSATDIEAFSQEMKIQKAEALEITRIYTDEKGESHFGRRKVTFKLVDYAPPAPPISVSEFQIVEGIQFISSPADWFGDRHPAPKRQLMFYLTGELEVKVSDGETRRFGSGCPILEEDISGKGHISRVVGS